MDGWSDEGNLIRKGSVVHALALSAQRFREKEPKVKQRFPVITNRSSRKSSQKLGIGIQQKRYHVALLLSFMLIFM
jgi:hypothetical protein